MEWLERGNAQNPTVLLLHGSPGHFDIFSELAEFLVREGFFVLAPNMPGYGKSPPLQATSGHDAVVGALLADLQARGEEEASIIGFSLGAYIGLSLALSHALRVRHVFTIGAYADLNSDDRAAFAEFSKMLRGGLDPRSPDLRAVFIARMLSPGFAAKHPEIAESIADWLTLASPAVLADELATIRTSPNLLPLLKDLEVPLCLRVGELDLATPPASSQAITEVVPNSTLQVVPGAGHCLLTEDWSGTSAAIAAHLAT